SPLLLSSTGPSHLVPSVMADAQPRSGTLPITVTFSGSATESDSATISKYEWDFDGDGVYDFSSPTSGNTSHQYTVPGSYSAVLRVTDSLGVTMETTFSLNLPGATTTPMLTSTATGTSTPVPLVTAPPSALPGSIVSVSWSGIPNPSGSDWIGLYK